MDSVKCHKCGFVGFLKPTDSYQEATTCKGCGASLKDNLESAARNRDYTKISYQPAAVVANIPNTLARISLSIFGITTIILNINKDAGGGILKFPLLLISAIVGLFMAIVALSQASGKNPVCGEKKTAIAAVVINGLFTIILTGTLIYAFTVFPKINYRGRKDYAAVGIWQRYQSPTGKFSVTMPGKPVELEQSIPTDGQPAKLYAAQLSVFDDGSCMAGFIDFPDKTDTNKNDPQVVKELLAAAAQGMIVNAKGQMLSSTDITLGPYQGLEYEVGYDTKSDKKDLQTSYKSAHRIYWVEDRLYVMGITSNETNGLYQHRVKFFDSLQIPGLISEQQRAQLYKNNPQMMQKPIDWSKFMREKNGQAEKPPELEREFKLSAEIAGLARDAGRRADKTADWDAVIAHWQQAIKIMEGVKSSSPNYMTAQATLQELRNEMARSQEYQRRQKEREASYYRPNQPSTTYSARPTTTAVPRPSATPTPEPLNIIKGKRSE